MLFLSSTAFILMWFDISIFIFLKFILGVGINTSETDFNNLVNPGVYNIGKGSSMANHPTGSNDTCILLVYKSSGGLIQLLCGLYNNQLFKRTKYNNWREWESVSADIPSFYKNYVDLPSLVDSVLDATQLGFVFNDSNIDSMTRRGIYHVSGYSGSHFPTNAFGLLLFFGDEYKVQIFLDMYQNIIHYRRNVGDGWSVWYDVSATAQ